MPCYHGALPNSCRAETGMVRGYSNLTYFEWELVQGSVWLSYAMNPTVLAWLSS